MEYSAPHIGARVTFKLSQVLCPELGEVVGQINQELEVAGSVVVLSDGPDGQGQFAIVEVPGIDRPVIVPVAGLTQEQLNIGHWAKRETAVGLSREREGSNPHNSR